MYAVHITENVRIPAHDGIMLAATLFLPEPQQPGERFPAVLELIPYRKDDWRYNTDHSRLTWLAAQGYGCCRLDVRGTGSSEGIALDEYTAAETQDGCTAVAWLAAQPWCNGNVGMWGVSYGGFTAIQVAMQQPPALKAIFPVYATDDRYTDDVHYLGGVKTMSEMAQYAVSQVAMNALPPEPDAFAGNWAQQWQARLEATPPWTLEWLRQQADGPYWRRGSLAPDYARITCALYQIGGWNDGYTNAVLRMHDRCTAAPRKALIGNWVHAMPDYAYPGPPVDWLHELVRFFDCWLKGIDNGVMDEPRFTYFERAYTQPEAFPATQHGAWRGLPDYRAADDSIPFYLHGAGDQGHSPGTLQSDPPAAAAESYYANVPTWGRQGGLCYGAGMGPNGLARDLRPDDATALTFTSAPLASPLAVLGNPTMTLHLRPSAPGGYAVVRLADVAPDGTSALVSTGVLNLTHAAGHDRPTALEPGRVYTVTVVLKAIGYRFQPGHRLRLSLSGALFPILWPSPYAGPTAVLAGPAAPSHLRLPLAPPVEQDHPVHLQAEPPALPTVGGGHDVPPRWEIVEDVMAGSVTVRVRDGNETIVPGGIVLYTAEELDMTAFHADPAHASLQNRVVYRLHRPGLATEVVADGAFSSTAQDFHFALALQVRLNGSLFFQKSWLETIPRLP